MRVLSKPGAARGTATTSTGAPAAAGCARRRRPALPSSSVKRARRRRRLGQQRAGCSRPAAAGSARPAAGRPVGAAGRGRVGADRDGVSWRCAFSRARARRGAAQQQAVGAAGGLLAQAGAARPRAGSARPSAAPARAGSRRPVAARRWRRHRRRGRRGRWRRRPRRPCARRPARWLAMRVQRRRQLLAGPRGQPRGARGVGDAGADGALLRRPARAPAPRCRPAGPSARRGCRRRRRR